MAASMVSCVCWEWQRDDGGFSPYIPEVSNAIETSNHAGMGWHHTGSARVYTIDFGRMIQRKNNTGKYKVCPDPEALASWQLSQDLVNVS